MTKPERDLWKLLAHRDFSGLVFRRQQPLLGRYIVDFCCLQARVVVEVDGFASHEDRGLQDVARQQELEAEGFLVLRFTAKDVMSRTWEISEGIAEICQERIRQLKPIDDRSHIETETEFPPLEGEGGER